MAQDLLKLGIVCYPTVGGSGVIATEVARCAARNGHEVHLLSYDRPARFGDELSGLHYHNVQVSGYPLFRYPPYALALATRMLEVQQAHDIDLFHVHYAIPHAVSAYLAREMAKDKKLRFVTTLHGTDITIVGADQTYTLPTKFAINQSNAVTAVSEFLARETCEVFGIDQTIHVIPNFVDTKRYVPGKDGAWYARGEEERVVVHVSNFRPVKRVANVVRAFALICERVPARLLLVGDGPDREHALAVATDLGCRGQVEHLGNNQAIEQILSRADLFLMASETESFGLSILEAMSCGVPCVSTDVGGVRELMGDTGSLTRLGHTKEMADAALAFLTSQEKHSAAGAAARRRAIDLFDEAMVVERYFELYRRVLNEG